MRIALRPMLATAAVFSLSVLCSACGAAQSNLGTFKVNGKDANLGYATLFGMDPMNGVPRMVLVLSEKAPPAGADLAMLSYTGGLGASVSAPMLKYPDKGWTVPAGFDYFHPAAKNSRGWCALSNCVLKDAVIKDGQFRAHLVTTTAPAASGESIVLDVPLAIKMP